MIARMLRLSTSRAFILALAGLLLDVGFSELYAETFAPNASNEYITVLLPDTSELTARQFQNDCELLDPMYKPHAIARGMFEFRLLDRELCDSAISTFRKNGMLVNPVIDRGNDNRKRYTDRIVVEFRPDISEARKHELLTELGCEIDEYSRYFPAVCYVALVEPRGRSTLDVAQELLNSALCNWAVAEAATKLRLRDIETHDYRPLQWPFHNDGHDTSWVADSDIDALAAWDVTRGDREVRVAVLDASFSSGWANPINNTYFDHQDVEDEDLTVFLWDETDPLHRYTGQLKLCADPPDDRIRAYCSHGTSVLGVMAAAQNEIGIDGLAPSCSYTALKICDENLDVIDEYASGALMRAAFDWDIPIIVSGWDIYPSDTVDFRLTIHALDTIRNFAHAALFWPSGNEGIEISDTSALAANPNVFAVGATDHSDVRWDYSNYGEELRLVAPAGGGGVPSYCPQGGDEPALDLMTSVGLAPECNPPLSPCHADTSSNYLCGTDGTSMACPKAAGVAALVLSHRRDFFDSADVGMALLNVLEQSAEDKGDEGYDPYYGSGRINAARAIALVSRGDLNFDGLRDVVDLVGLINIVFRGQPCVRVHGSLANINCDDAVDIVDVVCLVNFVFRGYALGAPNSLALCPELKEGGLPVCCPRVELQTPPNDTFVVVTSPPQVTLTWSDEYWASNYVVEIDTDNKFVDPVVVDTAYDHTYLAQGLSTGVWYYWRVSATATDCAGGFGSSFRFRLVY